jgi:hypothetical protein
VLLRFRKIVHDAFAFQMAGQSAAATPTRLGAAAWRGGRILVIRTVSGVFAFRQIFNIYTLSFEFCFEQSQLFFSDLFAAPSASGGE